MSEDMDEPLPSYTLSPIPLPQAGEGVIEEASEPHGIGGSYIIDPKMGKRMRVQTVEALSPNPSPASGGGEQTTNTPTKG